MDNNSKDVVRHRVQYSDNMSICSRETLMENPADEQLNQPGTNIDLIGNEEEFAIDSESDQSVTSSAYYAAKKRARKTKRLHLMQEHEEAKLKLHKRRRGQWPSDEITSRFGRLLGSLLGIWDTLFDEEVFTPVR